MRLLLLNEIKQEAISRTSCSMPETWQYSTVEVRSPSLYSFVATKCGKLDTVTTQCRPGSLLIWIICWNSVVADCLIEVT